MVHGSGLKNTKLRQRSDASNNSANSADSPVLKKSQKRYQQQKTQREILDLLDCAADPFYLVDADWRISYVNQGLERLWNRSRDELVGAGLWDVFPDQESNIGCQALRRAMWERVPVQFEMFSPYLLTWVEANVYPTGEGLAVLFRDVTECSRAEKVLRGTEERFSKAFYFTPTAMAISHTESGKYLDVNGAWEALIGYRREEAIGRSAAELNLWVNPEVRRAIVNHLMTNRFIYDVEIEFRNRSGEVRSGIFSAEITIIDGQEYFLASLVDITERKRAEQQLRESEERFNKAFHLSPVMMSILSARTGRYIEVNDAWLCTMGYERQEVIGMGAWELGVWSGGDLPPAVRQVMIEKQEVMNLETEICTKNGEKRYGLVSTQLTSFSDEPCYIVVTRDITELVGFQKELARLDRLNLIGEMAAAIGHEIRNPMTSVRGFLQMLGGKDGCGQYRDYFELMIDELDRANRIISDFLSMANNKAVNLRPYCLDLVIQALYPLLQADANLTGKQVILDLGQPPAVLLDENEVRRLILKLARNGIDAMQLGGTLVLGTRAEDHEVVLYVRDEGPGFDPMLMDKLGTPFVTTKDNGTGLGLAICYSIASRHNAAIKIDTRPGETTVSVRFKSLKS